jgi:hypothetical protein
MTADAIRARVEAAGLTPLDIERYADSLWRVFVARWSLAKAARVEGFTGQYGATVAGQYLIVR